jgi:REP element-mobilizing transposase RayT
MDEYETLSHTKWECKYHVVFIPKCRRKTLYAELRKHLGEVFRHLAQQKESRIEEGHLMSDHVHMLIAESFDPSTGIFAPTGNLTSWHLGNISQSMKAFSCFSFGSPRIRTGIVV